MRAVVGFLVVVLGVAGCVGEPTSAANGARTCITTVTGPDGKPLADKDGKPVMERVQAPGPLWSPGPAWVGPLNCVGPT